MKKNKDIIIKDITIQKLLLDPIHYDWPVTHVMCHMVNKENQDRLAAFTIRIDLPIRDFMRAFNSAIKEAIEKL